MDLNRELISIDPGDTKLRQRSRSVTAIISTYNRADFIGEAVVSLLEQTVKPSRLIIVIDGSSDNTASVLAEFAQQIEVISIENGGKARALNKALAVVDTEFCWLFDDDDIAHPDALETLLQAIEDKPELGFVFGHNDSTSSIGRITKEAIQKQSFPFAGATAERLRFQICRELTFFLQACLIRRSAIEAVRGLDERFLRSQDYDLLIRLALKYPFSYCGKAVFVLRQHSGARGPAAIRHSATDRNRIWMEFDRLIGEKIADAITADVVWAANEKPPSENQALRSFGLAKAYLLSEKRGLSNTVNEIFLAFVADPDSPLTGSEIEWAREVLHGSKIGGMSALPTVRLAGLARFKAARSALRELSRGAYWTGTNAASTRAKVAWKLAAALLVLSSASARFFGKR